MHKSRNTFPINGPANDVDQLKGLKIPHKRPRPWSNSHSPVHNPHPMQINQHPSTSGTTVMHPESLSLGPSKEHNEFPGQTTTDSEGTLSFSEWRKKWMSKHTSSCGRQHFAPYGTHYRIMGGVDARKGSWPWMVNCTQAIGHIVNLL